MIGTLRALLAFALALALPTEASAYPSRPPASETAALVQAYMAKEEECFWISDGVEVDRPRAPRSLRLVSTSQPSTDRVAAAEVEALAGAGLLERTATGYALTSLGRGAVRPLGNPGMARFCFGPRALVRLISVGQPHATQCMQIVAEVRASFISNTPAWARGPALAAAFNRDAPKPQISGEDLYALAQGDWPGGSHGGRHRGWYAGDAHLLGDTCLVE